MSKVTYSVRGSVSKLDALAGRLAIQMARANHDKYFQKYTGLRKKYLLFKSFLMKKYKPMALKQALAMTNMNNNKGNK